MNKITIVSITIVLLFVGLILTPIVYCQSPSFSTYESNPTITPGDEGDHYPCAYEIWFYHTVLTFEDGQNWDAVGTFVYFMNKTKDGYIEGSSFLRNRLWNRETCECFEYFKSDNFPGVFKTKKNEVNLSYYNSSGEGLYPDYNFIIVDEVHNIKIDLKFHATSLPCWAAQESMNHTIPCGLNGFCSIYFIPTLEVKGYVTINRTTYNATGIAYFEHDFGDFTHGKPFAIYSLKELYKNLRLVLSYSRWLLKQVLFNCPRVIPSWHRSSDYSAGWIWNWIVFNNGWSIVLFRPTIFYKSAGTIPVFLYLSKDGENYSEIGCVHWSNIREKYIKRADIYIPVEYEIIACKDDSKLHIKYNSTTGLTELYNIDWVPGAKSESCTFYCCGNITGHYTDKNGEIPLFGCGATEQTRSLRKNIKHRSRDIDIILPPKGLGIIIRVKSHRLGFERFLKIQIRPRFEIEFYIKPIPNS